MNSLMEQEGDGFGQTLRDAMLASLTDDDLQYTLPGNPSLGALVREMGQLHHLYLDSFRTFRLALEDMNAVEAPAEESVAAYQAWFTQLDADILAALNSLTEDDLDRLIDRVDWQTPVRVNFHIFREAYLIFYGRAHAYLKALGKPLGKQWQAWIGV